MNAHTPGPWYNADRLILDGYKNLIATTSTQMHLGEGTPIANAKYIVTAVNSHAELVAALQAIVDLDDGDKPDLWHFEKEFANARAALAKAGV